MNKQAWIECAAKKGIDGLEIYEAQSEERRVTWFGGQMDAFVTSNVLGTSLRGLVNGKMANLALELVDDDKMEETLDLLIAQAGIISPKDPDELRAPASTDEVKSTAVWVSPSMEDIQAALKKLEKDLLAADPRVIQVMEIGWVESVDSREITNSLGLHVEDGGREQILYAGVAVKEGDEVKDDYRIEVVYDLASFDLDQFVKKTVEGALEKLGASSVPSGSYPVIFERRAMTSIFGALSDMYSGELIGKGLSPLKDAQDTAIFSDKITVVDDPKCTDALRLANYDDEGCPTRRKVLVDGGVFRQALHNTRSAKRMNTESTGNGFKSGYASAVSIHPMNCCILPGEKSLDEMMADMGSGLVITDLSGLHAGLNHVTTDFSLLCAGYQVENGKRTKNVALITVAGNFLELMKHVVDVGSDLEWEHRQITCPSIRFESCAIAGE